MQRCLFPKQKWNLFLIPQKMLQKDRLIQKQSSSKAEQAN